MRMARRTEHSFRRTQEIKFQVRLGDPNDNPRCGLAEVLSSDLVAWIIPKDVLSFVFFNTGDNLDAT